jgi:hypothetical protein
MAREQSSIGSSIYYGPRSTDKVPSTIGGTRGVEYLELEYTYDDLPAADANDVVISEIPSGAVITGGYVVVEEAITGATAFAIGLTDSDGTPIDADGLIASSTLTAGAQKLDGALIDTRLAVPGQLVASFTGTATAGAFKLRVEYYI